MADAMTCPLADPVVYDPRMPQRTALQVIAGAPIRVLLDLNEYVPDGVRSALRGRQTRHYLDHKILDSLGFQRHARPPSARCRKRPTIDRGCAPSVKASATRSPPSFVFDQCHRRGLGQSSSRQFATLVPTVLTRIDRPRRARCARVCRHDRRSSSRERDPTGAQGRPAAPTAAHFEPMDSDGRDEEGRDGQVVTLTRAGRCGDGSWRFRSRRREQRRRPGGTGFGNRRRQPNRTRLSCGRRRTRSARRGRGT